MNLYDRKCAFRGATLAATIAQDAHYRKGNIGQFWELLTVCFALVNCSSLYRVIAKILAHFGLPTRAPPRAPVKAYPLFQTA